ncbi:MULTISPECIES: FtsK/SpoIIIE domain-containing protein [Streptomyces]|uniref:FtsK/SpoIIIE domain-containing protein n=1 Tax=Streptomyces TaxID=1883 RepID=UPI00069A04FD|nr:conjugal transfer protein TraS [Streptomyces sp. SID7805]
MSDLLTLLEVGAPVAALGGGGAYLRAKHPAAFWCTAGLPISTARLLGTYGSTMESCGLTVQPSRLRALLVQAATRREVRPVPPRRGLIRPTSTGMRVRLRLAPGQEPADVAASAERLRHAWGVHAVYVSEVKPGVVELRLVGFDVLRKVRMPRKTEAGFLKVPVALREDATAYVRDYRTIPHQLTLGATLSGKSMFLRHLVAGLAPQPVALVGIDCKRGVELAPFAPRLSALATDPGQAADLLPVLVRLMEDRYDLIKARQGIAPGTPDEEIASDIWGLPESERPVPVVIVVDEVAELGKGATMLRAQLTGRVCHRVNDEASAKMALGDIAPEAVVAACGIAPERPGLAVAGDNSGGWSRIRTPYLSLADAAAACAASAHLVPDVPALDRFRPVVPAGPTNPPFSLVKPLPVTG